MKKHRMLGFLLFLTMLVAATNTSSGIYKWVDENGNVQYGDRPPTDVETSNEVKIHTQNDIPDSGQGVDRKQARDRLLEQYKREREEKKEAAEKERQEKKKRQVRCNYARDRLTRYLEHGRLYEPMDNQERRFLSDQERDELIAKTRAEVKQWCN
jgi:hypothetical protein